MKILFINGETEVCTQAFCDVVNITGRQFLVCQILNVLFDVGCVDFIKLRDAMMFLYVDQEIQCIIVVSLDGSFTQLTKMTVEFEFLQTVFC